MTTWRHTVERLKLAFELGDMIRLGGNDCRVVLRKRSSVVR
jgi:hypothetical protein